jgi:hypothetical protein
MVYLCAATVGSIIEDLAQDLKDPSGGERCGSKEDRKKLHSRKVSIEINNKGREIREELLSNLVS